MFSLRNKSFMNLPIWIARRYLFAKRSTNAINIISGISILGVTIGTAALVLVLSVFNGFEELLTGLFSTFNPDVKVSPIRGKTFEADPEMITRLEQLEGVAFVSQTLEEVAFFEYDGRQDFGILKGVDADFASVTGIDSTLREGILKFRQGEREFAVVGAGMRNKLAINIENQFEPMAVYMPRAQARVGSLEQPFRKRYIHPVGTFLNQQDYDNQYVLSSLRFAREILAADRLTSALEIRLDPAIAPGKTLGEIRSVVGPDFAVRDRYQQDEAFLKLMNIEKWMGFAILTLMLVLVAFNMVGSLWMIVLEKKNDISILKSMGSTDRLIRNIFLFEGLLLTMLGMVAGFVLALVFYGLQKQFGLIAFPGGFAFDAYPISIRWSDFLAVTLAVAAIGLAASILPARRAMQVPSMIRET